MKLGDRGGDVTAWQAVLQKVGFDTVTDGIFGPNTHTDTVEYQKELGIVANGIVGPQTIAAHNAKHPEIPYANVHEIPGISITGEGGSAWGKYLMLAGLGALAFLALKE